MQKSEEEIVAERKQLLKIMGQFVKNVANLFCGTAIGKLASMLAVIILARWLDKGDFGKLTYALAFIQLILLTFDGFDFIGVREAAIRSGDPGEIPLATTIARGIWGALLYLLLISWVYVLEPDESLRLLLLIFGLKIVSQSLNVAWFFQGIQKMSIAGLSLVISEGGFLVLVLLFFNPASSSLILLGWLQVFPAILASFVVWIIYRSRYSFGLNLLSLKTIREIFSSSFELCVGAFAINLAYYWGYVVLRYWGSSEQIATYACAHNIVKAGHTCLHLAFWAILPFFAIARDQGEKSLLTFVSNKIQTISAVILSPIIVLGIVFASNIMTLIYGPKFAGAGPVFALLLPSVLLVSLNLVHIRILIVFNQQSILSKALILIGLTIAVLATLSIPYFGIYGNAATLLASEIFAIVFMSHLARKHLDVNFLRALAIPFWGIAGMLAVTWLLPSSSYSYWVASALAAYLFCLLISWRVLGGNGAALRLLSMNSLWLKSINHAKRWLQKQ
jgi:polysaccharide transporter, PST family